MTTTLTYHDDPKVKADLIERIEAHAETDAITQGVYGAMNGQWRGCAVSCSLSRS